MGEIALDKPNTFQPLPVRHRHIHDDQARPALGDATQGFGKIRSFKDCHVFRFEKFPAKLPGRNIVIDSKDARGGCYGGIQGLRELPAVFSPATPKIVARDCIPFSRQGPGPPNRGASPPDRGRK